MSYTDLKKKVVAFSHRTDLDGEMDTFALLAESVMDEDLKTLEYEKKDRIFYVQAFNNLPDDYLSMRSIEISNPIKGCSPTKEREGKCALTQVTPEQLDSCVGTGSYFTVQGCQIEISPAPSIENPLNGEMVYFARIPSLTKNETNKTLEKRPMLYLAAMMMQVYLFLQDDGEMAKWADIYTAQVKAANKTADDGRYHLPTMRVA